MLQMEACVCVCIIKITQKKNVMGRNFKMDD